MHTKSPGSDEPNDSQVQFERVRLENSDGRFVCMAEVLPFDRYPVVLLWGVRVFSLNQVRTPGNVPHTIYREVFASAILQAHLEEPS